MGASSAGDRRASSAAVSWIFVRGVGKPNITEERNASGASASQANTNCHSRGSKTAAARHEAQSFLNSRFERLTY
jgi:hypothetical protein